MNQSIQKPTGLTTKDKIFWVSLVSVSLISIIALAMFMYYIRATENSIILENIRVDKERTEIMQQKCFDPTSEYDNKLKVFVINPSVSFDDPFAAANRKDDPLREVASSLQVEKQLVEDACNDARAEAETIQQVTRWEYFKSQWKKMI